MAPVVAKSRAATAEDLLGAGSRAAPTGEAIHRAPIVGIPGVRTVRVPGVRTVGVPGVTTVGIPGVTTVGIPGVTTVGIPGVTTVGIPGVTTAPGVIVARAGTIAAPITRAGAATGVTGIAGTAAIAAIAAAATTGTGGVREAQIGLNANLLARAWRGAPTNPSWRRVWICGPCRSRSGPSFAG